MITNCEKGDLVVLVELPESTLEVWIAGSNPVILGTAHQETSQRPQRECDGHQLGEAGQTEHNPFLAGGGRAILKMKITLKATEDGEQHRCQVLAMLLLIRQKLSDAFVEQVLGREKVNQEGCQRLTEQISLETIAMSQRLKHVRQALHRLVELLIVAGRRLLTTTPGCCAARAGRDGNISCPQQIRGDDKQVES